MSDDTTSADAAVGVTGEPAADTEAAVETPRAEKDWQVEAAKWKALARKHEGRVKELAPAAERLRELEDAQKSELEKLQSSYEEALGAASRAQHELWRERAARKHGLDDDLLKFLTGESEDELLEAAQVLASKLAARAEAEKPKPGPAPDPTRGQSPPGGGSTADQFAALFAK
ncbi:hypothetical protein [Marinitenerispora sediminis]|uniref:DUF4355 domain-containing protein n=1 Tax=Marinitenerispora sediminis TaxID=1931232 RepID=A0A368T716_9ACTN|nr:hypothetical protein [Marinitenerispora sediminis]RCV53476.1 hypothetical protein DEF23_17505 [Marinitenerispora sediminis]RCV59304.1 hypothetical protein DEF24_10045 [Marinitenerispora sediminis]